MTPEESVGWMPEWPGGSTDLLPAFLDIFLPRIPQGGTYVEIGSFFGRSIGFVGLARPDLNLVTVDPFLEGFIDAGETLPIGPDLERCRKYGNLFLAFLGTMKEFAPDVLGRLNVIRAPSARGMLVLDDETVDLVLVDGDHSYAATEADVKQALRVLKPGGICAVHDCGWQGDCWRAATDTLTNGQFAPWPVDREGWDKGCSSVWYAIKE